MTTYTELKSAISRTPVTLMVLTLDFCGRIFGESPCNATGTPCYNTYPTCKYKSAYLRQSKDYKFTSSNSPLPFKTNERPYLENIKYLPTEIKDNLTITGRVVAKLFDVPDTDIGIDPYWAQRSSIQGTFWKKLIARNPNYKGRLIKIYTGFLGITETEFQKKWVGVVENIGLEKNSIRIEIIDLLKNLAEIEIPPKLDIKLVTEITETSTELTLTTVTGLDSPTGYIRIKDEIIYYNEVDTATNQLKGLTRGYFSTVAESHKAKDKIQKVRYYSPTNPFDLLKEILQTDAGISTDYIDTDAFNYWRDWPGGEVNFSAIVSEPTKLNKLYFEIIDLIDCKSWIGEDLKITIRRNIPNEPDRPYYVFTDEANLIYGSTSVDLNEKSRLTRILIYWDKTTLGKLDEIKEYNRLDMAIDADAESADEYNETIEKKYFCRWLRTGYMQEELMTAFIKNTITRQLFRQRNAQPFIKFDVELKDSDIKSGSYCRLSTDECLNIDGTMLLKEMFQVVRRDSVNNKINLKLLKLPTERFCFIAPNDTPGYDDAADAQKEYGFITDNNGLIDDKSIGYHIW